MNAPIPTRFAPQAGPSLEELLNDVDSRLSGLGDALRLRDSVAIESQAQALHQALAHAVDGFTREARAGGRIPSPLRNRLARASGQVAAQRESLARATFALDRAIDLLMPDQIQPAPLASYSADASRVHGLYGR
jgi:hypothetical protein